MKTISLILSMVLPMGLPITAGGADFGPQQMLRPVRSEDRHDPPHIHLPGTDDVLVSQPCVYYYLVVSGFGASSDQGWMIAEDAYPQSDYTVAEIDVWMIYLSVTPTSAFNLGFQYDIPGPDPGPDGSFFWYSTESDLTHQNTGYYNWGYEFWYTHISLADCPVLPDSSECWFCLQGVADAGETVYWLGCNHNPEWNEMFYFSQDDGATWTSSQSQWGSSYDTYLILDGPTSLECRTWGEIKTLL